MISSALTIRLRLNTTEIDMFKKLQDIWEKIRSATDGRLEKARTYLVAPLKLWHMLVFLFLITVF
jgi:hypothetical protein